MEKIDRIMQEIVDKCKAYGFTYEETRVIWIMTGSEDAVQRYGDDTTSYQRTLEILSQHRTFEEVVTEIEKGLGINYDTPGE